MRKFSGESFIVGLTLLMIIFPELAMAGTGGEELQEVVAKTEGLITGNGGKLVALASVIGGVIWSAATGSLKNLIVPVVLGMVLGVGPSIVTGGISAII
jgi:type IV secretory pathway VirB2 component (pilin)